MGMGKKVLLPYTLVNGTSLAGSFQSVATSIEYMDRCLLSIICTGTPTGTVVVQASSDYNPNFPANATWFDMPLSLVGLTGAPQNYFIDIQQTAIRYIRIKYTFSAGVGNMTATISAKES